MDSNWTYAARHDQVREGDVVLARVDGQEIALYGLGGRVYATDNLCTHGNARLCDGFFEDGLIECPLHQGRFDVRDGRPMCKPVTQALRTYPVRIEDGQVFLDLYDQAAEVEWPDS